MLDSSSYLDSTTGSSLLAEEKNPFALPPDEEIFRMREEDKIRNREVRDELHNMKVHDKSTFSSRMSMTRREALDETNEGRARVEGSRDLAATASLPTEHRRREKENMADFIAKKREIFLVQMSLDTKRAEIRKLEERALQREEALRKSEQMLEEDALRFDAFLKENDEKVQEAIKRAEVEAKAKQDKVIEIKRLNTAIASIKSELNKYEEQLEDCRKYKEFMDSLTPHEWFDELKERKEKKIAAVKEVWEGEKNAIIALKEEAVKSKADAEDRLANAETQEVADKAQEDLEKANIEVERTEKLEIPSEPSYDGITSEDTTSDSDMYFHQPHQLLEIFSQLEEQNLFLIQNSQETEEALEELKTKYKDTKKRMDTETQSLKSQIEELNVTIKREVDKERTLKHKASGYTHGPKSNQDISLESLSVKVSEVYQRCGFDTDASISTLQMLTNIEVRLEEYLKAIREMPEDFVENSEKAKEKERRQKAREEKLYQHKKDQEARIKRSLERAQAPVHKKTGKPVMFRSKLLARKKKVVKKEQNDEEAELEAYLNLNF